MDLSSVDIVGGGTLSHSARQPKSSLCVAFKAELRMCYLGQRKILSGWLTEFP